MFSDFSTSISTEHVVNAGTAVGGGRPLKEDERRSVTRRFLHAREQPLVLPRREQLALERVGTLGDRKRGVRH
jgi:hypothetical protein